MRIWLKGPMFHLDPAKAGLKLNASRGILSKENNVFWYCWTFVCQTVLLRMCRDVLSHLHHIFHVLWYHFCRFPVNHPGHERRFVCLLAEVDFEVRGMRREALRLRVSRHHPKISQIHQKGHWNPIHTNIVEDFVPNFLARDRTKEIFIEGGGVVYPVEEHLGWLLNVVC